MSARLIQQTARAMVCSVILLISMAAMGCHEMTIDLDGPDAMFRDGDRNRLSYRFEASPFKCYVRQWWSLAGVPVLRDAPFDHLHHHSLMFAVNVDGIEFWTEAEKDSPGRQMHRGFKDLRKGTRQGVAYAELTQRLDWLAPANREAVLKEVRTITTYRSDDLDASLIAWRTMLAVPEGKGDVLLTGKEYYGLGMRFVQSMDRTGRFLNSDGHTGVSGTNDVRAKWVAYTAEADGHTVTVAVFDSPNNLRHPATWFTMVDPFAYITATAGLHHEPWTVEPDQPLQLCYGMALWDGDMEPDAIESMYRQWLDLTNHR